ncbi:hypothetical protein CHS0354_039070 [Potamilus streckersoni]|uniref:Molybdenum cofactor sulfurase n=1 Tax=Potamilus streckersoni TaxID=2493646 RepID=A0AAE0VIQ6_9BIVA|nr:hypothetical protein CHS0354_039070 [Potamilus streckersoni]
MESGGAYNENIENIRELEFPALKDVTYADHVGATLVARRHLEAFHKDLLGNIYGNPHSRSPSSHLTTDSVDQIRYRILKYFKTNPEIYSVIFTSGCTGALKLLAESFDFHGDDGCHGDEKKNKVNKDGTILSSANVDDLSSLNENKKTDRGCFCYLLDNHTSVQGMRELAFQRAGLVVCIDEKEIDLCPQSEHIVYKSSNIASGGNSLFAYAAESNFSGRKYPLKWVDKVQRGNLGFQEAYPGAWYTVLDAASFVSNSHLNLSEVTPDFVTLSFYKMFGFPTGLGALLVRNKSADLLKKVYFGGGTVKVSIANQRFHQFRDSLHDRFEDGTISFLDIISLRYGFDILETLGGGIQRISQHTFVIAQYFHHQLQSLHHGNKAPVAMIYSDTGFDDITTQGPIINFNILRADGQFVGFVEVDKMAQLYNIHLRTGCFCNIGACQKFLDLSIEEVKANFEAGHVCGDDKDLVNGRPTGSVRISFGYMSNLTDAQICLQFIVDCFLESKDQKPVYYKFNLENKSLGKVKNVKEKEMCHFTARDNLSSEKCLSFDQNVCCEKSQNRENNQSTLVSDSNKIYVDSVDSIPENSKEKHGQDDPREISNENCNIFKLETVEKEILIDVDRECNRIDASHFEEFSYEEQLLKMCSVENRYLTNIFLYPVKSCGAFSVNEWQLTDRGLLYDREWMIVSENGVALSQKREPKLCLLQPRIDLSDQILVLSYPGMPDCIVPLQFDDPGEDDTMFGLCTSKVCGDRVKSLECGQEVSDWLSEALQRGQCRLVRQKSDDTRATKLKDSTNDTSVAQFQLSLANESQYLLISRPSVKSLQQKIEERQKEEQNFVNSDEVPDVDNLIHRFRANLVIGGGSPFDEDKWERLQIGNNFFISQGECGRCQIICLDQMTGERSKEPFKTLAYWRGKKVPFGIHLRNADTAPSTSESAKTIRIGQPIIPF